MRAAAASKRTVRYFISYAHADEKLPTRLLAELKKQLGACRDYHFEPWQDTQLLTGEKWHEEIQAAAEACDFGLLLVSPSFLGSKYITEHELPRFVNGEKPCMPVALCPIDFDNQDLKGLEAAQIFRFTPPRASKPKTFGDCTAANHKSDFAHDLFGQIVTRLEKLFASPAINSAPKASPDAIDEAAYRAHIRKHYRHLQLEALGGDSIYRDIELQQIFIPQDARDCREWLPETLEVPADLTLAAARDGDKVATPRSASPSCTSTSASAKPAHAPFSICSRKPPRPTASFSARPAPAKAPSPASACSNGPPMATTGLFRCSSSCAATTLPISTTSSTTLPPTANSSSLFPAPRSRPG